MPPRLIWLPALWIVSSCGPRLDEPLPAEDDLYLYSLAVARQVEARVAPGNYLTAYNIGRVHQRFGFDDDALAEFERALSMRFDAAAVHRDVGFILSQRQDRMDDALKAYQQSLLADPRQKGVHTRIGLILNHQGRHKEAIQALGEELKLGDSDPVAHSQLGQAYQLLRDHERAAASFRRALELEPRMREALYGLSRSLTALGRKQEADAVLAEFRKVKDEEERLDLESRARKDNREELRRHTALTWLDASDVYRLEAQSTADPAARARFTAFAIAGAEESLRFDPRLAAAHRLLMDHHARSDDAALAVSTARRAVNSVADEPLLLTQAAIILLQSARRNLPQETPPAEVEEAIQLLERATELAPDLALAHREVARAILFRKRQPALVAGALQHALRALELASPPEPVNYELVAMGHNFTGNAGEALETLRAGVKAFPGDSGLRTRLRQLEEAMR